MNVAGIEIVGTQEECRKAAVTACSRSKWFRVIFRQWPRGVLVVILAHYHIR